MYGSSHEVTSSSHSKNYDYEAEIGRGCRLVQDSCKRKVSELEAVMEKLRKERDELQRQGEALRNRNTTLETELTESRKRNQAQMEQNTIIAQRAEMLRAHMAKLSGFRSSLSEAFSTLDVDHSGTLDRSEYNRARAGMGLRADFSAADLNHDGVVSRDEFSRAAGNGQFRH
mmetsp:Transcript_1877/g.4283  ORF Transcript_1877/g.4283 Transcript_1877/m.4283 type:complete len:172 (-) Transcript_1877:79-594(-)|eukprot:CAMPEP_0170595820 /NCGR_PEP_ID=MMETSP0224-20130122/14769_1 /TAXON_ID=285029 /ORGANISM="Togula jolla, Strain CCCM 725" /LENGTH=171 /DNA_ID=CAMNT_0010920033 /DNA_START=52 /DNA_END=567 /DNA_ORIENTATION=-